MGVFSLAGRPVTIRSWSRSARQGWCASIRPADWDTGSEISVAPDPIDAGTAISVVIPSSWRGGVADAVAEAARFFPLPVSLDGAALKRADWLAEAIRVETRQGCRIGVFRSPGCRHYASDGRLNFHGVRIPCTLPHVSEVGGTCWTARVDIVDAPALQLVLPARKEAVENAALDELRDTAAAVIFRAIAAAGPHRLSFKDWSEARRLGVDLPPAAAALDPWLPGDPDTGGRWPARRLVEGQDMIVVPGYEPIIAQPAMAALRRVSPLPGPLAQAEPAFAGYSWYDRLKRVSKLRFVAQRDGRSFEIDPDAEQDEAAALLEGHVDALALVATTGSGSTAEEVQCEADVAFTGDPWSCDPAEEIGIVVRRGATLSLGDLVDLFEAAAFTASDDRDADSEETQAEYFRRTAAARIVRLLDGDDAALEHQVRLLLADYRWIVPQDRVVSATMSRRR